MNKRAKRQEDKKTRRQDKNMFRVIKTRRNAKSEEKEKEKDKKTEKTDKTDKPVMEQSMESFFEAESAAVSLSKPWLRLERGIRLQKYRAFAEAYPGTAEDKSSLYKMLLKANDAKLLNTKSSVQYENGVIQSIRGLTGPPFKIEIVRATKKTIEDGK